MGWHEPRADGGGWEAVGGAEKEMRGCLLRQWWGGHVCDSWTRSW